MKTPVRGYAARRKWLGLNPGIVITIAVIAVAAGLWATGYIDPIGPFRSKEPSHRGMIGVPVAQMNIPAYTKVTRDHLWNPKIGNIGVIYLRPEQVTSDMLVHLGDILGRVMDHDKPANYVFTEADFLPKGTRPGLTAGIPSGKRAMRVLLEKIPGLVGLMPGDRFDIVSTIPIDPGAGSALAGGAGPYGRQLDLQARITNFTKQATVRVVVQNGNIVQPVTTRQVPVASTTLTSGLVVRTRPVQEVVIAVAPSEVAHLTEAMAISADLACVPRSGRPDDPRESITPESSPWTPFGATMQRPSFRAQKQAESDEVTGSTPKSPVSSGVYGAGFTPVETINGTRREILATPVKK
jgi:Flp pilus assembly protein CpaB